ncbi:MAG: hypothetical protein LBE09_04635 [Christensenellaceae bacterium]|jgi:hypothetical protein|nr:hypothetical protein [Christensenellaceae bacterium]
MNSIKNSINLIFVVLNIALFVMFSAACNTDNDGDENEYNPKVSVLEQPLTTNINVYANKFNYPTFKIPIVIDEDISQYNFYKTQNSDKTYVTGMTGEHLDDLEIVGRQYDCFSGLYWKFQNPETLSLCVFEFTVALKENWFANGIVRTISEITFNILDLIIVVPVSVKIFENEGNSKLLNESPIFRTGTYPTRSTIMTPNYEGKHIYYMALNWEMKGWGAKRWDDGTYATIVGFRFANEALRLDSFIIEVDNIEGKDIELRKDVIDLANVHYDLTSRNCYWSDNSVQFEIAILDNEHDMISDALIMQYTVNGGSEIHEANLMTVELNGYYTLLDRLVAIYEKE